MALLQTQQIKQNGLNPALVAASGGGDTFFPGATVFVRVKNGDAAPHTVTIVTPGTAFGQAIADIAIPIPAGQERAIGPLTADEFLDPSSGVGSLTYDAVTAVTVGVFSL